MSFRSAPTFSGKFTLRYNKLSDIPSIYSRYKMHLRLKLLLVGVLTLGFREIQILFSIPNTIFFDITVYPNRRLGTFPERNPFRWSQVAPSIGGSNKYTYWNTNKVSTKSNLPSICRPFHSLELYRLSSILSPIYIYRTTHDGFS